MFEICQNFLQEFSRASSLQYILRGREDARLNGYNNGYNFSSVFGQTMCQLAEEDRGVCAITAAMQSGTGLDQFAQQFPERFFDVGIAEGHAVHEADFHGILLEFPFEEMGKAIARQMIGRLNGTARPDQKILNVPVKEV